MARKSRKQIAVEEPVIECVSSEVFSTAISILSWSMLLSVFCFYYIGIMIPFCDKVTLFQAV